MNYKLVRSKRRTLALQIKDGELLVRAPMTTPLSRIEKFVTEHTAWIEKHMVEPKEELVPITPEEIRELADKAILYIPERVKYYASLMGVTYGNITIRNQRSKWGSCSSKGNLNFNCLLMLTPPEVIDSTVVHELCHLKEMNHSKRFYDLVLKYYPDYHKCNDWLKKNGNLLIRRMEKGMKL